MEAIYSIRDRPSLSSMQLQNHACMVHKIDPCVIAVLELLDRPIVLQIEEAHLGSMGVLFQDEFIQYNFLGVIVHPCWGVAIFHSFFTHP